jgi:hypothetical protein
MPHFPPNCFILKYELQYFKEYDRRLSQALMTCFCYAVEIYIFIMILLLQSNEKYFLEHLYL